MFMPAALVKHVLMPLLDFKSTEALICKQHKSQSQQGR
jgi:hypothetical protein